MKHTNKFRIRPIEHCGYPAFALEEQKIDIFGREQWIEQDRETIAHTEYEKFSVQAITYLRERHKQIMAKQDLATRHLRTPIIYLEQDV